MDNLQRQINILEREVQISHVNPWKVIVGSIVAVILLGSLGIWWFRPKGLFDGDDISWSRSIQFLFGLLIFSVSVLWLLWNLYMY
jgi:hypothetical protein